MNSHPTALELFNKFRPRFASVSLVACGWGSLSHGVKNQQRLYLRTVRGKVVNDNRTTSYDLPYIDYAESGLPFEFAYDRSASGTLHQQVEMQAARTVHEMLESRTLLIAPASDFTEQAFIGRTFACNEVKIGVRFELEGEAIPGLVLPKPGFTSGITAPWTYFVPYGSPEGQAIVAAVAYHEAASKTSRDLVKDFAVADENLKQALQAVA